MISKEYGKFTLSCDICGATADEEYETFQDAVDARKDIEWKSIRTSGEWADVCPGCLEE
jgi:beta-glucosidase/6-phospho-beta-glucosidase/beta-galactosidase